MADQADLGIPMKPSPPVPTMPPRAPNVPRPAAEPLPAPGSLNQGTASRSEEVDARTLIVGREISFSGDVTSCDRLIIEGSIEVNLHNCQNMVIAETGLFRGDGSTENADVYGRVEGGLVVRRRLLIRASGHVSGTITYGEIEIEAGGKISGTIQAQDGPKGFPAKRA